VYLMPPFLMNDEDLDRLTGAVCRVVARLRPGAGLVTANR
jgi:hypothetical protein